MSRISWEAAIRRAACYIIIEKLTRLRDLLPAVAAGALQQRVLRRTRASRRITDILCAMHKLFSIIQLSKLRAPTYLYRTYILEMQGYSK